MSDGPQVYSESQPKARTEHRCCECRGRIYPGERYSLFRGCWDGRWSTFKTCEDCVALRKDIDATIKDADDRPPFGNIYEHVFDCRDNAEWIRRYMATRRKRSAPPSPKGWMERAEEEIEPITTA